MSKATWLIERLSIRVWGQKKLLTEFNIQKFYGKFFTRTHLEYSEIRGVALFSSLCVVSVVQDDIVNFKQYFSKTSHIKLNIMIYDEIN